MPLHTYTYACGCRRHIQGRQCECFLAQLLGINNPAAFTSLQANYLPFNMEFAYPRPTSARLHGLGQHNHAYIPNSYSSCRRHDRRYRSRYDCPEHAYRRFRAGQEGHGIAHHGVENEYRRRLGRG